MGNLNFYVGLDMSLSATGICVIQSESDDKSSTGFCRLQGKTITVETVKTTPRTKKDDLARLRFIVDSMMSKIPVGTVMVCIEDYFTPANRGQIGSALKLVALGTVMRMALYEKGLPFYVIAPGQLKKYVTGKGNGPKSVVVREVYKKWGIDCADDNQADACVLAHMARGLCVDKGVLLKYQEEVVAKVFRERPNYNCGEKMEG